MYGDPPIHPAPLRGRSLVINSSIALVNAFMFFHYRKPEVLICWTMGQQCFNACMILILDAWEEENEQNLWLVNQAFAVFDELHKNGVHKLAELAVQKISNGLALLGQRREQQKRQAQASRGAAATYHPQLQIDTASLTDFQHDTVMGNTGMFLLEDTGLQSYVPAAFAPLGWNMAGSSAHPSARSDPISPNIPSPIIPVSQVTAAPFPVVMSPLPPSSGSYDMPAYYQYQQQPQQRRHRPSISPSSRQSLSPTAFTAINPNAPYQYQQQYQQHQQHQQHQHPQQQQQHFAPQQPVPYPGPPHQQQQHHYHHQQQQQPLPSLDPQHPQPQSFSHLRGPRPPSRNPSFHHHHHLHHHHPPLREGATAATAAPTTTSSSAASAGPRGIHRPAAATTTTSKARSTPKSSQRRRKG
jgi:hypothetical protein